MFTLCDKCETNHMYEHQTEFINFQVHRGKHRISLVIRLEADSDPLLMNKGSGQTLQECQWKS